MDVSLMVSLLVAAFSPAVQDADDWDFGETANGVVARVDYETGAAIAVGCQGRRLSVVLSGTTISGTDPEPVELVASDGSKRRSIWRSGGEGYVVSDSARVARFLKSGGRLEVRAPGGLTVFDLPTQSNSIDRVLAACGYALTDARDSLPDASFDLQASPRIQVPERALNGLSGQLTVELSCLIHRGRLSQCQSDRETPESPERGRFVATDANGRRVTISDPASTEGAVVDLVISGMRIRR